MIKIEYEDKFFERRYDHSTVDLLIKCKSSSNFDIRNILFDSNDCKGYITIGENNKFNGYTKLTGKVNLTIKNNNNFNNVFFYFPKLAGSELTKIGSFCNISDSKIHDGVTIKNHVYINSAILSRDCSIYPHAHLHVDTYIGIKAIIEDHAEVYGNVYNGGNIGSFKKVYVSKKGNPVYYDEYTQEVVTENLDLDYDLIKKLYNDYNDPHHKKIIKRYLLT